MAFWPSGDVSQSMKAWPSCCFTVGCFAGFTRITPYWLNRGGAALAGDFRAAPAANRDPGAAVGEQIGVRCRSHVERGAHSLPDLPIPGPFRLRDIDSGRLPQIELGEMGSALIGPRNEKG